MVTLDSCFAPTQVLLCGLPSIRFKHSVRYHVAVLAEALNATKSTPMSGICIYHSEEKTPALRNHTSESTKNRCQMGINVIKCTTIFLGKIPIRKKVKSKSWKNQEPLNCTVNLTPVKEKERRLVEAI